METTAQTGNPATKRPPVDYTSRPNPSTSTRPIEEVSCSLASKVWAIACAQLDASVQTYLDVSFTLGAASQDPLRVFSPTLESSENIDDKIHRLDRNIQKLQQARVTLCLARTCNTKLAPINRLPREILSHIFELLVISEYWELSFGRNEHEEDGSTGSCQFKLPKQQYTLSQVCTHWQQVMTTPALWSRIDLVMSGKYQEVFYARASHFVSRAGNAPLIIQIHEPTHSSPSDIQRLTEWLAPVAGQIYSLDVSEGLATHEMVDSVLRTWLKHGTPGTVKELTLSANRGVHFITPVPGPGSAQWEYIISLKGFENFFRPITMLRVSNVFPRWESHAYYGLTHLQLGDGSITEAQLVAVLFSSPQLCALSFGLAITEADSFDTLKASVYLRDLNLLNLYTSIAAARLVLRLIAPGSRPLRMSLDLNHGTDLCEFTDAEEVQAFLGRSNVTTCHFGAPIHTFSSPWFPKALRRLPRLRTLCLRHQTFLDDYPGSEEKDHNSAFVCPELYSLCIISCTLNLGALKKLLKAHAIKVLRILCCTLEPKVQSELEIKVIEDELSKLVPNVRFYADKKGIVDLYLNWEFVCF